MQRDIHFFPQEIAESIPSGTIYTIYSLNIKHLFELETEKKLKTDIKKIRGKIDVITWIKAKYLQEQVKLPGNQKRELNVKESELLKEIQKIKTSEQLVFPNRYRISNIAPRHRNYRKQSKKRVISFKSQKESRCDRNLKNEKTRIKLKAVKKIKGVLLNIKSQIRKEMLLKILIKEFLDSQNVWLIRTIKKIINDEALNGNARAVIKEAVNHKGDMLRLTLGESGNEGDPLINKLSEMLFRPDIEFADNLLFLFSSSVENNYCDEDVKKVIRRLAVLHEEEKENEIKKVHKRNERIRKAEQFLASDEFAKFAEDPYFNISKDYKRFIKLDGKNYELIDVTEDEKNLIDLGHKLSVFKGVLKDKWLNSTTYKIETADNIDYYVRLSGTGLLQIRKEKPLRENLIKTLEHLLDYPASGGMRSDDVLQVAIGFAKLIEFQTTSNFKALFNSDKNEIPNDNEEKILALDFDKAKQKYLRIEKQRYSLTLFNKLVALKSNKNIDPAYIHKNYPEVIACLLQGTLEVVKSKKNGFGSKDYVIHKIPTREKTSINDLSTWTNEICAFSPERGFIFFNDIETLEEGGLTIPYREYWKCIIRGVEYAVALRVSLQLLELKTTRLLNSIPEILDSFNQPELQNVSDVKNNSKVDDKLKDAEKLLRIFAEDLANLLKILPPLRSIAIPTNSFRSGHSVSKFSYLKENCFNFSGILGNIQKNIDELNNFLTFFKQVQLQIRIDVENSRKTEEDRRLSVIAILFTVGSIIYVSSSFVVDMANLMSSPDPVSVLEKERSTIIYFIILFLLVLVGCWLYMQPKKLNSRFREWISSADDKNLTNEPGRSE